MNEEITIKFTETSSSLPPYGEPVLIKARGVLQHVTYMLECADDVPDWFEPYHFEHDDDQNIAWNSVDSWALIDVL